MKDPNEVLPSTTLLSTVELGSSNPPGTPLGYGAGAASKRPIWFPFPPLVMVIRPEAFT
jgi:hypothetical protein